MYLYELHEFHSREEEMAKLQQPDQEVNPNYPPIPAELREHNLVVDAGRRVGAMLRWPGERGGSRVGGTVLKCHPKMMGSSIHPRSYDMLMHSGGG
jgi:hypothetical protein